MSRWLASSRTFVLIIAIDRDGAMTRTDDPG
jgi:hypothetical protein